MGKGQNGSLTIIRKGQIGSRNGMSIYITKLSYNSIISKKEKEKVRFFYIKKLKELSTGRLQMDQRLRTISCDLHVKRE